LMSSIRRRSRPIALVVLFIACVGPAAALDGDRIRPFVGLQSVYSSNLFYLDDRVPDQFYPNLKNGQRSDISYGALVGLNADVPISRQVFSLRSQATNNRYLTYNYLDYLGYNVNANLDWVVGSNWDGNAGVSWAQALGSFADTRLTERNLRNTQSVFASAMYRTAPDWKLRVAVNQTSIENSAAAFRGNNLDTMAYEVGSRYYSKGGDNFLGALIGYTDGRYPDREFVPGVSTRASSFQEYRIAGTVDWRYSGLSKLSGYIALTSRSNQDLSERDYTGPTARLTGTYGLSGVTAINVTYRRELAVLETPTSNLTLTEGVSIGPSFQLSAKLQAQANYTYSIRTFLDNPGFVVTSLPDRKDTIQGLSGTLVWLPLRNAQVNTTVSYDTRETNAPFANYNVLSVFLSGQISF